nr:unnamed protein product [Callosobruchus analis]
MSFILLDILLNGMSKNLKYRKFFRLLKIL